MHNKMLIALQSGVGAPDLCDIEISKFPNFLKGKVENIPLASLNDIIDPVKENFVQARFDIYSKDGQYYGTPYHVGATVMYYNTEILDKAGVNADDIDTWADFVEAGKIVAEKTGIPMTSVEAGDIFTHWAIISQQGSDFLDKDGKPIMDNEINIRSLQFQHDMVYKDKIAITAPGGNHHMEEFYGLLNAGGVASVMMPMWYMGRFTDYMPDLAGKIIVRPMPRWEEGGFRSAGLGGTGTVISRQSKHVELAKEFMAHAKLSKEANIMIWNILGFDPPRWDVWPELKDQPANKYTEYFGTEIFDILLQVKDEINPVNVGELAPQVKDIYRSTTAYHVLLENDRAADEALKELAEELRMQMD
jgi:arabinosaccharide transport system substrate-binding protein